MCVDGVSAKFVSRPGRNPFQGVLEHVFPNHVDVVNREANLLDIKLNRNGAVTQ